MRFVSVLLMLGLAAGICFAEPGGYDEKPWAYPDGFFADRDTYGEQEPNDPCGSDQAVACGDVVDPGCIDYVADHDWYAFEVQAGIGITCGTDESVGLPTVDTYIELYADDCVTQLTYDDDGGPGTYSLISDFVAPYTGTYHLLVRSYGDYYTGCYRVFFDCATPPPPPENDTCAGAEEFGYSITRCTAGSLAGDTSDYADDYSPTNYCTGYSQAHGMDAVYYMDLEEGDVCDFTYTEDGYDASLYILTDCGDMESCVVGADDPEEILGWVVPATGRYYLILDGYSTGSGGPWTLDYIIECPTPPVGACCYGEQQCTELLEEECMEIPDWYLWIGGEVCDPNPCPPTATESSTWGSIKANYR
jgi:hypothetical protein